MASSLRLLTSSLISRIVVRPTASSFLSHIARHQSYNTMPIDDFFDQSWLEMQMSRWPNIPAVFFHMEKTNEGRSLTLKIPGLEKMETDDGVCVSLNMPGLKKEDMKACVEHNTLFIQGKTHKECYLAGFKLPDTQTSRDIKEEMKDGMLKVTLPTKEEFMSDFIPSFGPWPYSDMFSHPSILGKGLCPVIAMLSPIKSFSIYKEENDKSLHINMTMPGLEKLELTTQGLRVSLDMPGLKRGDVKAFFDYDTFFIEGKTMNEHYITGINLPKVMEQNNNMIKIQKKGRMFHATLRVKKEDQ